MKIQARRAAFGLLAGMAMAHAGSSVAWAGSVNVSGSLDYFTSLPPYTFPTESYNKTAVNDLSDGILFNASQTYPGESSLAVLVATTATQGALRVTGSLYFSRLFSYDNGTGWIYYQATGMAKMTITDLIITGPNSSVNTSLNLHLSGNQDASSTSSMGTNNITGSSSVSLGATYGAVSIGSGGYSVSSSGGNDPTVQGTGWLENFDGNDVFTSSTFLVPTNTPFTVTVELSISLRGYFEDTNSGLAQAGANFGNTASFNFDGPVFNLPDEYTANSVSAGIVNNQFELVPEPGAGSAVLLAGLLWCLGRRRHGKG